MEEKRPKNSQDTLEKVKISFVYYNIEKMLKFGCI